MNQLVKSPDLIGAQSYRMTADVFTRVIAADAFGDAHVELVDGELIEMAPSQTSHGKLLMTVGRLLGNVYPEPEFTIFGDTIVRFDEATVRAPDITVIDTDIGDRNHVLPADILLAVEISQSTLTEDLGRKRIDYASAGIRHYWVVDVDGRRIHTYTDPQGADYAAIHVFAFGDAMPVPEAEGTITLL